MTMHSPSIARRLRARRLATVAAASCLGLSLALVVLPTTSATASAPSGATTSASTTTASPAATTQFVRSVPVCGTAKPGQARCFSTRLVPARQGDAGARPLSAKTASGGAGPAGGFTPAQVAKAYGANPAAATTETVAIVLWYNQPNLRSNLNTFNARYGLPAETATSFKIVNQNGAASPLPQNDANSGVELTLDVQSVRGMCNKCKIVLVEATTPSTANLTVAENTAARLADVVTNSWGLAESSAAPTSSFVNAFNHPGDAILVSTGDHGWFDWDRANGGVVSSNSPSSPASIGTTIAVGGTSLYLNDDNTRASESVWNANGPFDYYGSQLGAGLGASGGGCSTQFAAQAFQKAVAGWAKTGCGNARLAADVSAVADSLTGYDIYDTFGQGGWLTIGGTSLASPIVAGLWANAGGPNGVAYPAQSLYNHFKAHDGTLYDVTTGGNGACANSSNASCFNWFTQVFGAGPNQIGAGLLDCGFKGQTATANPNNAACDAKVGYDGPSGVGTPKSINLFN